MDPFGLGTQGFRHRPGEGHHIVPGLPLDLVNAGDVDPGVFPDFLHVFPGNHPQLRPGLAGENLHLQPGAEPVFLRPDLSHFGAGVTFDHDVPTLSTFPKGRFVG